MISFQQQGQQTAGMVSPTHQEELGVATTRALHQEGPRAGIVSHQHKEELGVATIRALHQVEPTAGTLSFLLQGEITLELFPSWSTCTLDLLL